MSLCEEQDEPHCYIIQTRTPLCSKENTRCKPYMKISEQWPRHDCKEANQIETCDKYSPNTHICTVVSVSINDVEGIMVGTYYLAHYAKNKKQKSGKTQMVQIY